MQVAAPDLEKLLVAFPRYTKCEWLVKPRLVNSKAAFPVVRLAPGVEPSYGFISLDR